MPAGPLEAKKAEQITSTYLQPLLADLLATGLNCKQAHWHVTGRQFTPVHLQLDEIVNDTRIWSDTVAERAIALGTPIGGQPSVISSSTILENTPDGFMDASKVIDIVTGQIEAMISRTRPGLQALGELDLVTQGIVISVLETFEKHLWMLRSQM